MVPRELRDFVKFLILRICRHRPLERHYPFHVLIKDAIAPKAPGR